MQDPYFELRIINIQNKIKIKPRGNFPVSRITKQGQKKETM